MFSDGGRQAVEGDAKEGRQVVTFRPRRTSSLRLTGVEEGEVRVQAWGRDRVRVGEDLAMLAP